TTRKHYIHNNPYLNKIKHNVYQKNVKKKTTMDMFDEAPLADLEHWLSAKVGVNSATIRDVRENHRKVFTDTKETRIDKKEIDNKIYKSEVFITEDESLERLKELQITPVALRRLALKRKAISQGFSGSCKYGKGFQYREEFIDDISRNWISAESLRETLKCKETSFWERARARKWRRLKIGRKIFINKVDCL
ncbi:MAG: hypothetical protein KGK03_08680, partial [Candidatus Omnitrophica bacterium]|nr:hypothetical protein [Candidatus Omnitrophota bacterium]